MGAWDSQVFVDGRALVAEYGIRPRGVVYRNLDVDGLYQAGVQRGQGTVLANGVLHHRTDPYYGRAAKSSFYVRDPDYRHDGRSLDELIVWGDQSAGEFNNLPIAPATFRKLRLWCEGAPAP